MCAFHLPQVFVKVLRDGTAVTNSTNNNGATALPGTVLLSMALSFKPNATRTSISNALAPLVADAFVYFNATFRTQYAVSGVRATRLSSDQVAGTGSSSAGNTPSPGSSGDDPGLRIGVWIPAEMLTWHSASIPLCLKTQQWDGIG